MCPFDYTAVAVSGKVGYPLTGLTTPVGWLVTPTDRPKSVRNRCVNKVFGGVCVLSFGFRIFCCVGIGGFVIGLGQISFFFPLLICTLLPNLTFCLIVWGFHRTFVTGAACQQRTLTPPDTWSCPTLGLARVLCRDQSFPNLSSFRTYEFRTSLGTSVLLVWDQSTCKERVESGKYKIKILAHIGTQTHNVEIGSLMLYRLSYMGFDECCAL